MSAMASRSGAYMRWRHRAAAAALPTAAPLRAVAWQMRLAAGCQPPATPITPNRSEAGPLSVNSHLVHGCQLVLEILLGHASEARVDDLNHLCDTGHIGSASAASSGGRADAAARQHTRRVGPRGDPARCASSGGTAELVSRSYPPSTYELLPLEQAVGDELLRPHGD